MKYKVEKGTPLFDKLIDVQNKLNDANNAGKEFLKKHGFNSEKYYRNTNSIAGGIGAVAFGEKPEGWTSVGSKWQGLYMPKSKGNKSLWEEISALPTVKENVIQEVFGCGNSGYCKNGGLYMFSIPKIHWLENVILVEFPDEIDYTPVEGLVEILGSEFKILSK